MYPAGKCFRTMSRRDFLMRLFSTVALLCAAAGFALAQAPAINTGGVVNTAGSPSNGAIAPGALVTIFGTNLASGMTLSDSVPLSTSVGGTSVTIAGTPAPIQFASPTQINVQAPWGIALSDSAGPAAVVVTAGGNASASASVTVAASAPAIYNIGGQALAVNSDGTLAAPANSIPGIPTRPAAIGDAKGLIIFATGMGAVDVPVPDGANSADQTRNTLNAPTVLIGGVAAQVTYSGLSPQFPGVNQINVTLPAGTPTGNNVHLQIQVNGISSNVAAIAVSQ
jgi:uncharacterized protein (TIGR03437 family)